MNARELIRQLIQLPMDSVVHVALRPDGDQMKEVLMAGLLENDGIPTAPIIYLEIEE